MTLPTRKPVTAAGAACLVAVALAACASSTPTTSAMNAGTAPTTIASTPAPTTPTPGLTLESGWVKAGTGMTALFGTVRNTTDAEIVLMSGSSPSAASVEVHTMAKQPDGSMTMVRLEGGLKVPAGGSAQLQPGADHVMLIGLANELVNGDEVTVTMSSASGARFVWTVPVRSFGGAEETYLPGGTQMPMSSHATP